MGKRGLDPRSGWASETVHFLVAAELLWLDKYGAIVLSVAGTYILRVLLVSRGYLLFVFTLTITIAIVRLTAY